MAFIWRLPAEIQDAVEATIIPPGGHGESHGQSHTPLRIKRVQVVARTIDGEVAFPGVSLYVPNNIALEGRRKIEIQSDRLGGHEPILPGPLAGAGEIIRAVITNDSRTPIRAKVVVWGIHAWPKDRLRDWFLALTPAANMAAQPINYRIQVPARKSVSTSAHFPFTGHIRHIQMWSNSKLDVDVWDLRAANVCLLVDGRAPVEFFYPGVGIRTLTPSAQHSLTVSLQNNSDEPRWVEVDVALVPSGPDEADEPATL